MFENSVKVLAANSSVAMGARKARPARSFRLSASIGR
jgi:hypothetical protein